VVMGMGGSSLFPEVIARTFGAPTEVFPPHVTRQHRSRAVRRVLDARPARRTTLFLASSKSGGSTIETRSHLDFFWDARPGGPFAVITDPGSALGTVGP
jgi:transaldolase/glucose-6-phosphate isomerase